MMHALWEIVWPPHRIRERTAPFKNEKGDVTPAGPLGKYYELQHHQNETWRPVDPAEIRRFDARHKPSNPFQPIPTELKAALEQGKEVFEIRIASSHWEMSSLLHEMTADRTDSQAQFDVTLEQAEQSAAVVHFASPDFLQQAVVRIDFKEPEKPIDVTLHPVRRVRARVLESPSGVPRRDTRWSVFAVDPPARDHSLAPSPGRGDALWARGLLIRKEPSTAQGEERELEMHLPAGRYKVVLWSDTLDQTVEFVVPAGNGPIDIPDMKVESLAWLRMIGKPAAEIEVVDADGKPAKLADFQGKVVVLTFWSHEYELEFSFLPRLIEIQKRFKSQPLAIVALHDASIASVDEYKQVVARRRAQLGGETPLRFLLDLARLADGPGLVPRGAGYSGRGKTADAYDVLQRCLTLVIDRKGGLVLATGVFENGSTTYSPGKDGQLVRDFGITPRAETPFDIIDPFFGLALIELTLEDQFGLPRSPLPDPDFQGGVASPDCAKATGSLQRNSRRSERKARGRRKCLAQPDEDPGGGECNTNRTPRRILARRRRRPIRHFGGLEGRSGELRRAILPAASAQR